MAPNGTDPTARPLPGGGGGMRNVGDGFRPNLAMGGGSTRISLDLPHGPGGVGPKLDLLYSTGLGQGLFGMGWALSVPFVEQRRPSAFRPAAEPAYTLSGAEPLVELTGGRWAPQVGERLQTFTREGAGWLCRTPDLVTTMFGSDVSSRLAGDLDGRPHVARWYADRTSFPNGVEVLYRYETVGAEHRLRSLAWSAFDLLFEYEPRPDPSISHALGFEMPLLSRCRRILLRHRVGGAPTDARAWELSYDQAPGVGLSLLTGLGVVGWHAEEGTVVESRRAPVTFGYTRFDPGSQMLRKFGASTSPPPALGGDTTLMDHHGTSLPGILRLSRTGATYWENRGGSFGPPQQLRRLPGGVSLAEDPVRFADLTGNGTADLLIGQPIGGTWFEHDPATGFAARHSLRLAPGFAAEDERSTFLDLDGDGVVDLLAFREGRPFGFINDGTGHSWAGPFVLPWGDLPARADRDPRLRFVDMSGDGLPDVVLLRSRGVVYWPNFGGGRLGRPVTMEDTPDFDVPDPDRHVLLADVDGTGTADLVLLAAGEVRIHLNGGGRRFGPAVIVGRTPPLSVGRVLLADMTGSGTAGLLWTLAPESDGTAGYLHLDLLGGVKPYLLASIDNGGGLRTEIQYTTSARERARDLATGRRWTGYLPFPVHVVASMTSSDAVSGQSATTRFRYHDGHFDGRTRRWLGFAEVESIDDPTPYEAGAFQRQRFHNQVASAGLPAFEAGRGQPYQTETADGPDGRIHSVSTSTWSALAADPSAPSAGAWISVEAERTSTRSEDGVPYAVERITYDHDEIGNVTREVRRGEWSDDRGAHVDEAVFERQYGRHAVHGLTSVPVRERRFGGGQLLRGFDYFYDGPAFVGLLHGQVERGLLHRQTEVALTPHMRTEAYGPNPPGLLDELYRRENDPELGAVHVHDTRRYATDEAGNQVETLDALGRHTRIEFDPLRLSPVAISDGGFPPVPVRFDPVLGQATLVTDANGHTVRTRYNGLGDIVAVWRRDADPARPTETYSHDRSQVPHRTVQRVRILPGDAEPGWERHSHLDGAGRAYQVHTRTATGWAVERTKLVSVRNHEIAVLDCYEASSPDFDPTPPPTVARHVKRYDSAGRLVHETLFGGAETRHVHRGLETLFYDPDATAALAADPATPPSRVARRDAWDRLVAVVEPDGAAGAVERREYDAIGNVVAIVDATGAYALRSVLDGWGNRVRVDSAEAGVNRFVLNADNNEVLRIDAGGGAVFSERDARGRVLRIRSGGPAGPVEDTFTYDTGPGANLGGRLARAEGAWGTAAYSYDADGNATHISRTFAGDVSVYDVAFTYDTQGNVRSVTYPDGHTVAYDHDPTGRLRAVSGVVADIAYGPHGQRTMMRFTNGLESRRSYSAGDHLLTELVVEVAEVRAGGPVAGVRLQHVVYDLDAVGRVVAARDRSTVAGKVRNDQTFTYDLRNRMAAATGTGPGGTPYAFTYAYDAAGNLVDGEAFTGMVHDRNRPVRRGGAGADEYAYDAAGNLTRDPELGVLEYDARHRLVRVTRPNGDVVEYDYDHNDRRVSTRVRTGGATRVRREVEGIYVVDAGGATKVVFDENRRLALLPSTGNGLLHHTDRLGNVNVVSNLDTGAFAGANEYTPYGALMSSVVISPHFAFAGAMLTDGLDIVLLGARWYSPTLGRFLTWDGYLLVRQEKIPGLHGGAHLYLYALNNPANFSDPTGRIAFLVVLVIAAVVGAVIGAVAAAANGVDTWDEFLLWVVAGAIGGVLSVLAWTGIILGAAAIFGASVTVVGAALAGLAIFGIAGLLGALATPLLDDTDSPVAWAFSFLIKWIQSPIVTTVGLIAAGVVALRGGNVDFRRGMLFIEIGPGGGALTLGGVAWTQSGRFDASGNIPDDLARHEAVHSRTVAAVGDLGFYFTYVVVGGIWGVQQGGAWNDLNSAGCGNPFEKTAHTFTNDPGTAVSASSC